MFLKLFFLKLSFPKVILYLHLWALNKLLPNVFLITTIYLHFIPDNTLLLFRHRPWFRRLQVLSLSRTTGKPTFAALEADSRATLQREDNFLTAWILPSILLSDFWKGKKAQLTSTIFFFCSQATGWAPTWQIIIIKQEKPHTLSKLPAQDK